MKYQSYLFLIFIFFSGIYSQGEKRKTGKNVFTGPLFTYAHLRFETPNEGLGGFAPGLLFHTKFDFSNRMAVRYSFRGTWGAGNFKRQNISTFLKDFDTSASVGYNLIETESTILNFFAGLGFNRFITLSPLPIEFIPDTLKYNMIFFTVGFNPEWRLNENWGFGIEFQAQPDIHPHVRVSNFLPDRFFKLEYAYALELTFNLAYEKKYKSWAWSMACLPYLEFANYGKIAFPDQSGIVAEFLGGNIIKILAGASLFFGVHF